MTSYRSVEATDCVGVYGGDGYVYEAKGHAYGYYTKVGAVKWLYVQVTYNGTKYTGFCCGTYLSKQ